MILQRTDFLEDGVFGELLTDDEEKLFVTLEHAYPIPGSSIFSAKVPKGEFLCVRGIHHLSGLNPIETFEVTGVLGHSGILFHVGNFNHESDGCILLGQNRNGNCIEKSMVAFGSFMNLLEGVKSFQLVVV